MKPEYKPLKELTSKVQKYKTKVKVVHKGYPQQSPNKPRYQRIVFEDDEGFSMKGTLFNNDIEKFAEALQRKGEYEIDDATVNPVAAAYAVRPNEYSIVINDKAKINPLILDQTVLAPDYQPISSISRDPSDKTLYDILGVVIYVSETREVERSNSIKDGRKDKVRDIHIMDHSYDRSFSISLWNEIIDVHETLLQSWADCFPVAGFTALTGRNFKGFTMSSTMSTAITFSPQGARADALQEWASRNKDKLIDNRSKLAELNSPDKTETITEIRTINDRKAHNTWQEEVFTIRATLPTASFEQMHLYIGCNKCSRKCTVEPGARFTCEYCGRMDAIGSAKIVFKVDAVDDTGSIHLPIFVKHAEELVGLTALELWNFTQNGDLELIAEKLHALRQKTLRIKIGPTLALTTSRVLSWAVKSVAFETPPAPDTPNTPASDLAEAPQATASQSTGKDPGEDWDTLDE